MLEFIKNLAFTSQDGAFASWELIGLCGTVVFFVLWLRKVLAGGKKT
jgi:lipid-A-disaccharide synthase-like uncharacterized protein